MKAVIVSALCLAAALPSASASAQTNEDHPCVQEVCIGDGLEKLRGIDWQTVAYTSERVNRIRKEDRARRAKTFPGFGAEGVASYLVVRKFDRDIIGNLRSVSAACEPNELVGTFFSQGGHKTVVTISLLPTASPEKMVWRVIGIARMYTGLERPEQRKELHQALNEKYSRFVDRRPGESSVLVAPLGKETLLTLLWVDVERNRLYGSHSRCEKPRKLTL